MSVPSLSGNRPSLLVGRERELGILREHLRAALDGQGSLVLIGGEAGIGKTALAETLCAQALGQGALVLIGRCFDLAETPAYGPWLYLFDRYQPDTGLPARPVAFAERGLVGATSSQAALFRQVRDFIEALTAQGRVLLLLDDLHWSDPASLDLLRFLAQSVATSRLLILVAYRSDELTRHHPLYQLLPLLVREANATRLDLHALGDDAVRALIATRYRLTPADADRLVAYLQARAEGNALFVGEVLRALEERGVLGRDGEMWRLGGLAQVVVPALLRQVIDGRLGRLDEDAQRLLAIAAVIGHEVPIEVWARVGDVGEEAVLATAEQGLDARLLVEVSGGERVRFAHALIRETLYERIPGIRQRRVHRRVGEALAAGRNPDPDAVAFHFQRAEDDRALPWLLTAGERAQAAYAWVTAAARFEAALALMERAGSDDERGWLLLRSARLLRYADVAKARAFADEAVALARGANDEALAAVARHHRGLIACLAGDVTHGLPELEAGAAALATLSGAERAHFAVRTAGIATRRRLPEGWTSVVIWRAYVGRYREARELGERLVAAAAAGDEAVLQSIRDAHYGLGEAYAALGMPDEAAAMFDRAHDAYLQTGHHALAAYTSWRDVELVALPYRTEDITGRRLAERGVMEMARARNAFPGTVPPHILRLPLLLLEGQWEEVERLALVGSADERGITGYRMTALGHLATLARLRGDTENAWQAVGERLPAGSATEPGTVWPFDWTTALQRVAAALALDDGDLPTAKEWLEAHDRWLAWSGAVLGQSEGQALWARYHRVAGDTDQAWEHAQQALAHAAQPRQPLALVAAHRLVGELDTDTGRYEDADAHLDESLALADACAAPYERALTLLAMASLHIARGNTADAQQLLVAARAICEPLGAQPALARADVLAARVAAVPIPTPTYPAGLSAREVEVLQLVAAGLTNVQVGARLFLSPRTVEQHLRSIFNKTGATSRTAASRFATEHHLV